MNRKFFAVQSASTGSGKFAADRAAARMKVRAIDLRIDHALYRRCDVRSRACSVPTHGAFCGRPIKRVHMSVNAARMSAHAASAALSSTQEATMKALLV